MKDSKILFIAVLTIAIALSSCKKEGLGGKAQIKGQTYSIFTGKVLKGTTIYIKYGASTFPGNEISKYDASDPADSDGKFEYKELVKGDYYLYATGFDNGQFVSGGVHVYLNKSEIKENIIITLAP